MLCRRAVLACLAAAALAPSFARAAVATSPAATVQRYGPFYIVDGWVLTRADLEALGVDAG